MATSPADLVALLRELREALGWYNDRDLRDRIDAALAERQEVQWLNPTEYDMREFVDDKKNDRETWVKNCITHWEWGHEVYGAANSEREAKEAALAAARGMK